MLYYIAHFLLWLLGWRIVGTPKHPKKGIMIGVAHTTYWDAFFTILFLKGIKPKVNFFIKKEFCTGLSGYFFRSLGGIPIERSRRNNIVEQSVAYFNSVDSLYIALSPEGTRKKVKTWKSGFYHIAKSANIPIFLGYVDYHKRQIGVMGDPYYLTDDMEQDIRKIQSHYTEKIPRYPKRSALPHSNKPTGVVHYPSFLAKCGLLAFILLLMFEQRTFYLFEFVLDMFL